ncbi:MAG: glycoside hydrolase family 25 protein [Anaerolineae bacterium]|nr:glycoside hydrolase family 25 protein [Anaerolineae bacterium]
MFRLLGPHVNSGDPDLVARWKPPVVVVLDPNPEKWARMAPAMPQTRFVWRPVCKDPPDFNQPIDPEAEARRWMADTLPLVQRIAGGFWQGLNEVEIGSQQAMGRYATFEVERVRLLTAFNARAGVGGFAAGTPGQLSWWGPFLLALQAAQDNGGVLLLHEYTWPRLGNDEFQELRHRKIYGGDSSRGWEGLPAQCQAPLIISQCGLDVRIENTTRAQGWQGVVTKEEYLRQLAEYSQELERDEYCLGGCIYCLSDEPLEEERTYNIWPDVAETIIQTATPLYRVTSERARGVDVSEWRSAPDWRRAAENGTVFALVRASIGTRPDKQWPRNAREAQAANLVVLPWHYQTPGDDVADQVQAHLQAIGSGWPITWTDVEITKGVPLTDQAVQEFVDRVAQAGQRIGIYSSAYMIRRCGVGSWAASLPRWWADWNPRNLGKPQLPVGWPPGWDFQQITAKGTVPGINPPTDLDIFGGTAAELTAWCAAQGAVPDVSSPP